MLAAYMILATGAYVLYEQLRFAQKRRKSGGKTVPGPKRVIPIIGGLIEMVMDPYSYWETQRKFSDPGFSYNSLFGKFFIFVTDSAKCRELMAANDPSKMLMVLHPSAKNILGPKNIAFIHGPEHKELRKSFMHLFTRKALSTYVVLQDAIIRNTVEDLLKVAAEKGEFEIRPHIRDLNQFTSQEVFVGPYLDDPVVREKFSKAYSAITDGFLVSSTVWEYQICNPSV
jgi:cytochrome P450 family 710 subfamily A protein